MHRRGTPDGGCGYVSAAIWAKWDARRFTKGNVHPKTMKTPRTNYIFRLDLLAEDPAIEKPFANVPFYSIKHTFWRSIPISLSGLTALTGLTAAELAFLILSIFIMPKKSRFRGKKNVVNMREQNIEISSMETDMPY